MSALPQWCDTDEGRALIEQVVADPPEWFIRNGDRGAEVVYIRFGRPDVAALKQLYQAWYEQARDGYWAKVQATGRPDQAELDRITATEEPDHLIGRLLTEQAVKDGTTVRLEPLGRAA